MARVDASIQTIGEKSCTAAFRGNQHTKEDPAESAATNFTAALSELAGTLIDDRHASAHLESMTYNRSRVMKTAHAEWRATRHRPGATFSRCLKAAWAAEKMRVDGPKHYNPAPEWTPPKVAHLFEQAGRRMRALLAA